MMLNVKEKLKMGILKALVGGYVLVIAAFGAAEYSPNDAVAGQPAVLSDVVTESRVVTLNSGGAIDLSEFEFGYIEAPPKFSAPRLVTLGEINNDKSVDAVVVSYLHGAYLLSWVPYLENGFSDPIAIDELQYVLDVVVIDLNQDGNLDIVASDYESVWGYMNDGAGSFEKKEIVHSNDYFGALNFVDMNGDGVLDIVAERREHDVVLLLGTENGEYVYYKIITNGDVNYTTRIGDVSVADVTGDGLPEVLVASYSNGGGQIFYHANLGNANFSNKVVVNEVEWGKSVVAADLDYDGYLDLLSASNNDGKVAWYKNLGGGIFSGQRVLLEEGPGMNMAIVGDVDEDGLIDVISARNDEILWFRNLGNGGFSSHQSLGELPWGLGYVVEVADVDKDGVLDLFAVSEYSNFVGWFKNFSRGQQWTLTSLNSQPKINSPIAIAAGQLAGNEKSDLVFGSDVRAIGVYEQQDDGSFGGVTYVENGGILNANDVSIVDLNHDGDNDILHSTKSNLSPVGGVAWYENLGFASFSEQQTIEKDILGSQMSFAMDVSNDGDLDVLSLRAGDEGVYWYRNNGQGGFSGPLLISNQASIDGIVPADMDRDGDLDVVIYGGVDGSITRLS